MKRRGVSDQQVVVPRFDGQGDIPIPKQLLDLAK